MTHAAYCLFETPLGSCGIAWSDGGQSARPAAVTFLQLPDATTKMTESRIVRCTGAPRSSLPPPPIAEVIERLRKHLQGHPQDLRDIAVDLNGADPFARQVYEAAREIPSGQTRTYGELAKAMGQPTEARAVGQALGRNPIALIIPCHRIVAAGGKPGGFSAHGGRATKARLLAIEGATAQPAQLELSDARSNDAWPASRSF
jgi:methylated-DNA-[protein]-cysteine S-methyltransferase